MRRRILYLATVLCMAWLLAGCGGQPPHETEEVEAYIREEIGITDFRILKEPKSGESQDSGERIWRIKLLDGSEQVFHVLDAYSSGLFYGNYYLTDDYADVLSYYEGADYAESLGMEVLQETAGESEMVTTTFKGQYADRPSLEMLAEKVQSLGAHLQDSEHPCTYTIELTFMHPLRDVPEAAFIQDDADLRRCGIRTLGTADLEDALQRMVIMSCSLQYREVLAGFTEAEIRAYIAESSSCIGICHGDPERDSYEYYKDLCGAIYGGTISFPTLYEILVKEAYPVEGDPFDFRFTGVDGSSYEFCYDYPAGREGCYYTKDGEQQEDRACLAYLYPREIENMTGLSLYVWAMDYQPNAGVYAEDGHLNIIETFYLDGEEMTYEEQTEGAFHNTTSDYKELRYDGELQEYRMIVDIGLTSDNMSYPVIWREWACAMGGNYRHCKPTILDKLRVRNRHCYKSRWNVNGNRYTLLCAFRNNEVKKLILMKNGKRVDLAYRSYGDPDYSGPSFCVEISVDEFADLMGLTYEIDESEGSVRFLSLRSAL